jgi:hypothetical protein
MERTEKKMQVKNAVMAGIMFGVMMGAFYAFQDGVKAGIIGGLITGSLFGVCLYFFTNSGIVKRQTKIDEDMGEVLLSGGANHFINKEAVGGRLYLLSDKLYFKSHRFNIQNHELEIPISDIVEVDFYNTLGLIPNGLAISTHDGTQQKFVVNDRKNWKQEILKIKSTGLVA